MGPVGISVLLVAGFAAFAWLGARKLAIVVALRPEPRWDQPWRRLRDVAVNGLLQRGLLRGDWKAGVMHAVIFAGFVSLLVRKVQLIAIGYDETIAFGGAAGGAFAAFKDAIELAVLGACGYALYRRRVVKPARLERNREALVVLGLIVAIMLTDLAFDAFRFALHSAHDSGIAHERAFAFAGNALATLVAPLPARTLAAGQHVAYWTQMIVVMTFLAILPLGEHFHIVTALPTLYFRRGRPAHAVPFVDLDAAMADEAAMRVGARSAADLTWKEALDAFTCTECGRCKDACPTSLTGKPLSMKAVNDSVKKQLLAQRDALRREDREATLPALVPDVIAEDTLWACTTCGYCEAACPIQLEHLPRFYRLRQHRVMMDGAFPRELRNVFEAYEVQSNPWGLPADTRGDWAAAARVRVLRNPGEARELDYLYYVGSAGSFDARGQRIAGAFARILKAADVRFAILGARETSTGECVRRAGNEMLFQQLARALIATLDEFGAQRIVTCDPHAFNTLKNEYPALGGNYEVLHHTELIARLLDERRIDVGRALERVIYHDPCYLGRHNGEYEAPRAILRRLAAVEPLEFDLRRERSMCCGAGGARMWMEETIGRRINVTRVEQALAKAPGTIATACPYCTVMLTDGTKSLGNDASLATRDIAELVADALLPPAAVPSRPSPRS